MIKALSLSRAETNKSLQRIRRTQVGVAKRVSTLSDAVRRRKVPEPDYFLISGAERSERKSHPGVVHFL